MTKTTWVEIVDEDERLILSMQLHWQPYGMTAEEIVMEVLPGLSELYPSMKDCCKFRVFEVEDDGYTVH